MKKCVLSISYGNYLIQNGGTDKVIREHQKIFNDLDVDYIFIFPVVRNIVIGKYTRTIRYWGLDINKKFIGILTFPNLLKNLKSIQNNETFCSVFIHHTWRIDKDEVLQLCRLINVPVYYYLHDFQAICANRNFVDHTGTFCGYGIDRKSCSSQCSFFYESECNRNKFSELLVELKERIKCVAPSENTKNIYCSCFRDYADCFFVHEHQKLESFRALPDFNSKTIRIAYIGSQATIKGWDDFKNILQDMKDGEFEVFYLGTGKDIPEGVHHVEVSVRDQGDTAMQDALIKNKIDIVFLLSCWPETYSYTYFESYAAGCYILTYNNSGNMADQVRKNGTGKVFSCLEEIKKYIIHSNCVVKDLMNYRNSSRDAPSVLLPNDKIVNMAISECNYTKTTGKIYMPFRRSLLPECIYRIQNRGKMHNE